MLAGFFKNYPDIIIKCNKVKSQINNRIGRVILPQNEISFDLILPFLFPNIINDKAEVLSFNLAVYREIIDCYNKKDSNVDFLLSLIDKDFLSPLIAYDEYQKINENHRLLIKGDIVQSYMNSVERVYYRELVLKGHISDTEISLLVQNFSAFLLFDDDVYDLKEDFSLGKETILTQYLNLGITLEDSIKEMLFLFDDERILFNDYTKIYKLTYQI